MGIRTFSAAFDGAQARLVDVQVQIAGGLPNFVIVGLADKAVAESRERVRAAFAAVVPSSIGGTAARAPPKVPIAVRAPLRKCRSGSCSPPLTPKSSTAWMKKPCAPR